MLPLIAVVGYSVGALVAASIVALRAGRAVVPRVSAYAGPVVCYVHPDLAGRLDDVRAAVAWWRALGHDDVSDVVVGHRPEGAEGVEVVPAPPGVLVGRTLARASVSIDPADGMDDRLVDEEADDAHDVELDAAGRIVRSTVYVDPLLLGTLDARRVLAHELGHAAYGFAHVTARLGRERLDHGGAPATVQVPKHGHLMHPVYSEGGWGHEGLLVEGLGMSKAELRRTLRDARRGR